MKVPDNAAYTRPYWSRADEWRDYIYQIKRLAHPRLHSPILGLMGGGGEAFGGLEVRLVA